MSTDKEPKNYKGKHRGKFRCKSKSCPGHPKKDGFCSLV